MRYHFDDSTDDTEAEAEAKSKLSIFCYINIQVIFKTAPGPKVVCICLGGALGMVQDKIFCAYEDRVKGYTKKGKQFLAFNSNMVEPISCM